MSLMIKELFESSRKSYFRPGVLKNFITPTEIKTCLEIYDSLPVFEAATNNKHTRKDYLMHSESDPRMRDLFLPKLKPLTKERKFCIDGGNFTTWHSPVKIHTDGYQFRYNPVETVISDRNVLGFAVLVPLRTDTGKGTPKTIFFRQTCFGEEVTPGQAKNGENIDHWTGKDFDFSSVDKNLLDHQPADYLAGFSIDRVLPWNLGDALIWHRAQFHCASSFQGYNDKLHLIFFVNYIL